MPPATILQYRAGKLTLQKYWDFPFTEPSNGNSKGDYIEELDDIFKRVNQTPDQRSLPIWSSAEWRA